VWKLINSNETCMVEFQLWVVLVSHLTLHALLSAESMLCWFTASHLFDLLCGSYLRSSCEISPLSCVLMLVEIVKSDTKFFFILSSVPCIHILSSSLDSQIKSFASSVRTHPSNTADLWSCFDIFAKFLVSSLTSICSTWWSLRNVISINEVLELRMIER
jgi:hypothetical protein